MSRRVDWHDGALSVFVECNTPACDGAFILPAEHADLPAIARAVNDAGWRHTRERVPQDFCPLCVVDMREAGDVVIHEEEDDAGDE